MRMVRVKFAFVVILLSLLLLFMGVSVSFARERLIIIGTATSSGLFYPIGVELCKIINKDYLDTGIRCIANTTGGAEYNLMALRTGEIDIALATSFAAATSYSGDATFSQYGPDKTLRHIARLYSTPITFVVRSGAIRSLDDLKGKRFNLGNRGGAKRSIAEMLFREMGWSDADLRRVQLFDLTDDLVTSEFCKGNIDGFVMITGIPSPLYDRVLSKCNGELMDIPADILKMIVANHASLSTTSIPPGKYNKKTHDIHTFALDSIVMASSKTPDENVLLVHSALKNNRENLIKAIPALKESDVSPDYFLSSEIPVHQAIDN